MDPEVTEAVAAATEATSTLPASWQTILNIGLTVWLLWMKYRKSGVETQHDAKDETLQAYGQRIIPAING